MELIEVLNSVNWSFSGILDDTLLNRLSTSLLCDSKEHNSFWENVLQILQDLHSPKFKEWLSQFTNVIKSSQLVHPNLLKVYFACVQQLVSRKAFSEENLGSFLNDLKSFIKTCLLYLTNSEVQHIIVDCCISLFSPSSIDSYHQLFADDVVCIIIKLSSSFSIFASKSLNKLLSKIFSTYYSNESDFPLSLSVLCEIVDKDENWILDFLTDLSIESIKVNNIALIQNLLQTQSTLLPKLNASCMQSERSVKILYFYYLTERYLQHTYFEILLNCQLSWSTDCRLSIFLKIKRRCKIDKITFDCHSSIFPDLLKSELKQFLMSDKFGIDVISDEICDILDAKDISELFDENEITSLSNKLIESPHVNNILPLLTQVQLSSDKEMILINKFLCGDIDWQYINYFEMILQSVLINDKASEFTNIVNTIQRKLLADSHLLGLENAPLALCCLSLSNSTTDLLKAVDYQFLVTCQENQLNAFIRGDQNNQYSCAYLTIMNNLSSHLLNTGKVVRTEINCSDEFMHLIKTCDTLTLLTSELKENIVAAMLYQVLSLYVDCDIVEHFKSKILTILMESIFDYRLLLLSKCVTLGFHWISMKSCRESDHANSRLHFLVKIADYLIENDLFAAEYIDHVLIQSIYSLLNIDSVRDNVSLNEDLNKILTYVLNLNDFCSTCGESIDLLLGDILIAVERPTSIDCIGD